MTARAGPVLAGCSVWLLVLACLLSVPAWGGWHDDYGQYRAPRSDHSRREVYRRYQERRVDRRYERAPRHPISVPEPLEPKGFETPLSSPVTIVLYPLTVFSRPDVPDGSRDVVYRGRRDEMVYAMVSREYREPGGTVSRIYVEFTGRQQQRVSGWVDDRYFSGFIRQDKPWMAEFVAQGGVMTNPSTNPTSLPISSNVSAGTQAKVVGYTWTAPDTWYLLEEPQSGRLLGWANGSGIKEAGFLAEQAQQQAAERERQLQVEQQQREEAAAQARLEQQEQQWAAQQAQQEQQRLIAQQQQQQWAAQQAWIEQQRAEQARLEHERQELVKLFRYWAGKLVWITLAVGVFALVVPTYRYSLEGRASTGGFHAVVGIKTVLSLSFLAGFMWMSVSSGTSTGGDLTAIGLAALGLPGAFLLPGIVLLALEFLHYVFVPHPVERSVRRLLRTKDLREEDFADITRQIYDCERDGLLPSWRFRNLRQQIEDMQKLVEQEDQLLDQLGSHVKKKAQAWR